MESLEKFIQKRMHQCDFEAMMIPRYLENTKAFLGKNTKTMKDVVNLKKESKKCKAILTFLKEYNKMTKETAIDWLVNEMISKGYFNKDTPLTFTNLEHLQIKAKEIEKKQIIDAYNKVSMNTAQEYYKETFEDE